MRFTELYQEPITNGLLIILKKKLGAWHVLASLIGRNKFALRKRGLVVKVSQSDVNLHKG